jgi:hypothetical protein
MSNTGLTESAARFLEVGERHDAARGRRKKTITNRPRRAEPVVENVKVELVQSVVWDVEVPQPVVGVEPATERMEWVAQVEAAPSPSEETAAFEVFGPVVAVEPTETTAEHAEAGPPAYVDPFAAVCVNVQEPAQAEEPAVSWEPEHIEAAESIFVLEEQEDDDEVVREVEASSLVCLDCDLPIEPDTDQCPHCALFLPRAA